MSDFNQLPLVIETADLWQNISTKDFILIDIGSITRFAQGHIQGARHIAPKLTMSQTGFFGLLPSLADLEKLFGSIGHTSDTTYIIYDDEGGGWAGRFIWILDSIGHKKYHYLNGGLHAWIKDGYPLSTEQVNITATTPTLTIDTAPTATLDYIQTRLNDTDFAIWDARSPAEYDGEKVLAARGGHIPGAINLEWTSAMDMSNGLRIRKDIAAYLVKLGITKDKEIVTHCQSHHRSGFTYLIARALDYPRIKAYAGSWSEWGNNQNTPVES